jgi:hypothetical protein
MAALRIDDVPGLPLLLAAEALELATAEQYVVWAQDALTADFDSPSLLQLAIEEPPYFTPDLRKRFHSALDELNVTERITLDQAMLLHAQQFARAMLAGNLSPRECAERIESLFPDASASLLRADWVQLDEAYDCDYCLSCVLATHPSIEAAIEDAARSLAAANWREV